MVAAVWTLKNKKGAVAYTTAPLLMVEVYAEKKNLSTPFFEKNTREIFFTKMKDQQISLADKQKLQEEVDQLQTELYREDGF